ncbi:uncharacterized protein BJ171DRAFT_642909 [Polychytrium aggregatum]|uniref:uncharacterized protein n=1 Tax=Polychytrium aggregatum TaxID=110093 RepID=UPI0022FDEF53|nr:uncharacterized protein BJ171DRAFT_642909 [Polychytrium aggregatum]KAI9193029.1 hypothetical protein BJ171DRAFT_642909 [Polychytrium aggregatum]
MVDPPEISGKRLCLPQDHQVSPLVQASIVVSNEFFLRRLDVSTLLRLKQTCKTIDSFIRGSKLVQFRLWLDMNGMDIYHGHGDYLTNRYGEFDVQKAILDQDAKRLFRSYPSPSPSFYDDRWLLKIMDAPEDTTMYTEAERATASAVFARLVINRCVGSEGKYQITRNKLKTYYDAVENAAILGDTVAVYMLGIGYPSRYGLSVIYSDNVVEETAIPRLEEASVAWYPFATAILATIYRGK